MKAISIVLFAGILTLCTARPAPAVMTEYSTTNRAVTVTNTLPASEVRPLAAYILFPTPATGTVSISRVTRGVPVPLARHGFTNAAALTWLAPADFPIRRGEALSVSSTVSRFTLQLETSTGSDYIERSDAPEWYDEGRPYSFLIAGGSSQVTVSNTTQIAVSNAPHIVVTNLIVITNAVTVNTGGAGGPQFIAGPGGEYVATNALSMDTFGISGPNVSAVLDWDGWVDFSGCFAVPAKLTGGSPMRGGEVLFDASQGANGKFYGYRNDTWHAFLMDDEAGGGGADNLGNGYATNNVDLQTFIMTASSDAGGYRIGQPIRLHGFAGGDSDGGAIELIGGDGNGYTPGAILIRAGGGGGGSDDSAGATLTLAGGNGAGGSGSVGANLIVAGGTGGGMDGTVVLQGNHSHGNGSGGVLLDLQDSDLKIRSDATPVTHVGAIEDVTIGDVTLHFVRGIYTGHTGP